MSGAVTLSDVEVRERVAAVEVLLAQVEALPEDARAPALEAVQLLVELYGEALARLLARGAERGHDLASAALEDELLAHLLLLHGLHPAPLTTRVEQALEDVRPYLASHGGGVELLAIEGGTARLRLHASCNGCAASSATLRGAVEEAILLRAPEIETVEAEGDDGVGGRASDSELVTIAPLRRGSDGGIRA